MKHCIKIIFSVFFIAGIAACSKGKNSTALTNAAPPEVKSGNNQPASQPPPVPSIDILDSKVSINDNYELQVYANGNWHKFKTPLPKADLTQQEFTMRTSSVLNAKLKCLDSHCSKSEINVDSASSQHQLHIEQLKVVPVGGEFLLNCEVPMFFPYEFDTVIGDNPRFKKELIAFANTDKLEITYAQIKKAPKNQEAAVSVSERVQFRFKTSNKNLLTVDTPSVEPQNTSVLTLRPHHRFLKKVSVNSIGTRSAINFDWVKFHFPFNQREEICYHMAVIPQVL